MEVSDTFFGTVVKLVQLGGLGVGALIFLFVFILLFRNQPVDAATAALRSRFLTTGVVFAIIALGASLLQLVFTPKVNAASRMMVTFSPSFSSEHLPAPAMLLSDTGAVRQIEADNSFDVAANATLKISVDDLINAARSVQQIKATAQTLLESNKALTSALTAPAATPGSGDEVKPGLVAGPVKLIAPEILVKLNTAQASIARSLRTGDYAGAATASRDYRAAVAETPMALRRIPSGYIATAAVRILFSNLMSERSAAVHNRSRI